MENTGDREHTQPQFCPPESHRNLKFNENLFDFIVNYCKFIYYINHSFLKFLYICTDKLYIYKTDKTSQIVAWSSLAQHNRIAKLKQNFFIQKHLGRNGCLFGGISFPIIFLKSFSVLVLTFASDFNNRSTSSNLFSLQSNLIPFTVGQEYLRSSKSIIYCLLKMKKCSLDILYLPSYFSRSLFTRRKIFLYLLIRASLWKEEQCQF